jgi:hypothetical protein
MQQRSPALSPRFTLRGDGVFIFLDIFQSFNSITPAKHNVSTP